MAAYDHTSMMIYDGSGNLVSIDQTDGTVDDGGGNNFFQTTDAYTQTIPADGTLTYIGTIDIDGVLYPAFTVAGGTNDGNTVVYSADVVTAGGIGTTVQAPDPLTTVTDQAFLVCFAAGTEIATPEGIALVEDLKIGDMVRTFDGRDVAVKWVGRQTVSTKFRPAERLQTVTVAAGALGDNLPSKDLTRDCGPRSADRRYAVRSRRSDQRHHDCTCRSG